MIRRLSELTQEPRRNVHGGDGVVWGCDYLKRGEMAGVLSAGRNTLEPGASIGEHAHPDTEDLYVIVEGRGTGILNGERFPVEAGDAFLVKAGGTHGLSNEGPGPLTFVGVLTRQGLSSASEG